MVNVIATDKLETLPCNRFDRDRLASFSVGLRICMRREPPLLVLSISCSCSFAFRSRSFSCFHRLTLFFSSYSTRVRPGRTSLPTRPSSFHINRPKLAVHFGVVIAACAVPLFLLHLSAPSLSCSLVLPSLERSRQSRSLLLSILLEPDTPGLDSTRRKKCGCLSRANETFNARSPRLCPERIACLPSSMSYSVLPRLSC